jgi:hypothetical protein
MMKHLVLVVAVAFGAASPMAASAAQPPLHLIASTSGPFVALDATHGYYDLTAREMRIVTLAKPRGRAVATPEGCSGRGVSLPDRIVFCEAEPNFRILDTRSGVLTPIDTSPCGDRDRLNFGQLGRYWIGGQEVVGFDRDGPVARPIYLNRTTGECRRFDPGPSRDVDRPNLPPAHRPTCADAGRRRLLRSRNPGWDVIFCHSKRKPVRLCRAPDCDDAVLGRHSAAWLTGSRVHAVRLDSGRRFSWRLAPLAKGHTIEQSLVSLLQDRLYLTLLFQQVGTEPGRQQIFTTVLAR